MSESLQAIQDQLQKLAEIARKYEEKKKRDTECARMSYHRRMARERGIPLEEWLNNPTKGRGKTGRRVKVNTNN